MRKLIPVIFLLFFINSLTTAQVTFNAPSLTVPCDTGSFCINIEVVNFDSVVGFQYSYAWDPSILTLTSHNNLLPPSFAPNESEVANGQLGVSWNYAPFFPGLSLPDNTPIIELCFSPVSAGTSPILFDLPILPGAPIEVFGCLNNSCASGMLANLPYQLNDGSVVVAGNNGSPVLTCPGDTVVMSAPTNVFDIGWATLTDCDLDSVAWTLSGSTTDSGSGDASGAFFNSDTSIVTYTAVDLMGNTAVCSFNVILDAPVSSNDSTLEVIPEITIDCDNDQLIMDFIVVNFDNMLSYQYLIQWDTSTLSYSSSTAIIAGQGLNTIIADDGYIFSNWTHQVGGPMDPPSTTLPDSTTMFTVTFDLLGAPSMPFIDYLAPIEFNNEDGNMDTLSNYVLQSGYIINTIDNTPPTLNNCPTDTTIYVPADACTAIFNYTTPTATDACDPNPTVSCTQSSGSAFNLGPNNVTCTAIDASGNMDACSFIVTVLDTLGPVIICPNDTIVSTDPDKCSALVDGLAPVSVLDNCTVSPQISWVLQPAGTTGFVDVSSSQSMQSFALGVNTITYIAIDDAGNSNSCSFTVTVQDLEAPVVDCPSDILLDTGSGSCNVTTQIPAPGVSDNCGVDSLTYTINGTTTTLPMTATDFTSTFPVGTTTITYILYDQGGLTDTCDFDVVVSDNAAPTLTCPGNIMTDADAGSCDAIVTVPAPMSLTDNCGLSLLTYLIDSTLDTLPLASTSFLYTFPSGSTTVTYTAWDQNGNSISCNFTVDVADGEAPNLVCPTDTTLTLMGGSSIVVGDIAATATDLCGTPTLTYGLSGATTTPGPNIDDASGTSFNMGTTTVTYYANDGNGNIDSCSFFVNVTGGQLDVDCPMDAAENSDPLDCGNLVFGLEPIINSDINNLSSFTYTMTGATIGSDTLTASGNFFNVGVTTVTYFFSDIFGNDVQCSFTVTVTDTTPPTITCPTVDAFPSDLGECFGTVNLALIIPPAGGTSDNCGIDSIAYSLTGTTTGEGTIGTIPTVYDIGTTTVTYTIFDDNGLTNTCMFDIVINDSEPPIIDCPNDTLILVPSGTSDTIVNDLGITYSDLCGVVNSVTFNTSSGLMDTLDVSGNSFPVGNTVVTYEVTDEAGNISTCTFLVAIVEDNPVDLIDCPNDTTVCDNFVTGLGPTFNVDVNDLASLSFQATGATPATGLGDISSDVTGILFNPGTTIITYTAVDINNFVDECTFILQVDDENPVFANCPTVPIVIQVDPNECKADAAWIIPTATDNCSLESLIASTIPPATMPIGDSTITYVATDLAGNMTTCSFIVSVVDVEPPVFNVCPPNNIVYNQLPGTCDAIVTWDEPIAVDGCSNVTLTSFPNSGDLFTGNVTVVYTATDESGNSATCSFEINTADNSDPVINDCPTDTIISADPTLCGSIYDFTLPTATDDCSMVSVSCSHMPGDTFGIGTTTVICIAIDAAGNDTTCTFTVDVVDVTPPTFTFCTPDILVTETAVGECGNFVSWPVPEATDDCDTMVSVTSDLLNPGDFFEVGTTTVTYTATDDYGNTAECTFVVNVQDNFVPIIDCGSDVIVGLDGNVISDDSGVVTNLVGTNACDSIIIFFNPPVVDENCPMFTVTHSGPSSGMAFPVGVTTLEYEVEDASGNISTCMINFEVLPLEPIEITATPGTEVCSGTAVQLSIDTIANATYAWTGPGGWTSTDPSPVIPETSGNYVVVCTLPSGCTNAGNIDITYSAAPIYNAWTNTPICNENIELNLAIDATSPPVDSFVWEFANGTQSMVEDPIIVNPTDADIGTYTLTLYSGLCSVTESFEVNVVSLEAPNIFSDCDGALCLGESCTLIGTTYSDPVFYNWTSNPPGCVPAGANTSEIVVTPNAVGNCVFTYWVVLDGCVSDTVNFVLNVSDDPVALPDTFTTNINTAILNFDVTNNDVFDNTLGGNPMIMTDVSTLRGELVDNGDGTFSYTPADGFTGTEQFIYQICHNCDQSVCATAVVTLTVVDESCLVPNIITPNGDGLNETVRISCLDLNPFPNNSFQVFNQWGDEVYFAQPYNNDWNGTLDGKNGDDLPDGTYYYIFRLDSNAEADKGYLTIFR